MEIDEKLYRIKCRHFSAELGESIYNVYVCADSIENLSQAYQASSYKECEILSIEYVRPELVISDQVIEKIKKNGEKCGE